MTYLTGLALGISAGRQLNELLSGTGFTLVHALSGRRRYRHEDLIHNPDLACQWERQLLGVQGIYRVQFTPLTGSVLIEYTCPDEHIDVVMSYLQQLHTMPDARSPYGKLGLDIQHLFRRLNRNIFQNTGRFLDLRTLLAVGLLIFGARKVWMLRQLPSGPQMVWWAYSLLRGRSS